MATCFEPTTMTTLDESHCNYIVAFEQVDRFEAFETFEKRDEAEARYDYLKSQGHRQVIFARVLHAHVNDGYDFYDDNEDWEEEQV